MAAFTGVVDIGGEPSSRLWENWSNNILAAEEILADWSIITAHSTVKCTTYSSLLAKTKFRKSQSESDATYGQTNKMLGVLMSECIATSSDKQQWITVVFCILSALVSGGAGGVRWSFFWLFPVFYTPCSDRAVNLCQSPLAHIFSTSFSVVQSFSVVFCFTRCRCNLLFSYLLIFHNPFLFTSIGRDSSFCHC